jgi:dUTP pyrophosphatase
MNVKIKLVDPNLPIPEYKTEGAVAFDMYSRLDMEIPPFTPTMVPTNLMLEVPLGYFLMIAARSSLPKTGLMLANGAGVIDHDFNGDEDEMALVMLNFTKVPVKIEKGQRLAQGILVKIVKAEKFTVVKKMPGAKSRGGFGTTGRK